MSGVWYPDNLNPRGFFGNATSPINWCEIDYEKSTYFAEYYNTLTNLSFNFIAIICYSKYIKFSMGCMFFLLCIQLHFLGLTSGLFHASLSLSGQKLDEIFMNYVCITLLHIFDHHYRSKYNRIEAYWGGKKWYEKVRCGEMESITILSKRILEENLTSSKAYINVQKKKNIALYYYLLHCFVCGYFILAIKSMFAEIHMTIVIIIAIYRYIGFISNLDSDLDVCNDSEASDESALKELTEKTGKISVYRKTEVQKVIKEIRDSIVLHLKHFIAVFLLAYLGWNIENHFCDTIRKWPFNPQFHAIWHILCGIAVNSVINIAIVYLLYLRTVHMNFLKNNSFEKVFYRHPRCYYSPRAISTYMLYDYPFILSTYGREKLAILLKKEVPKLQFKMFGLWSSLVFAFDEEDTNNNCKKA